MDIGELLSYKPPNTPKRNAEGEERGKDDHRSKVRKLASSKSRERERPHKVHSRELPLTVPALPIEPIPETSGVSAEEKARIIKMVEEEELTGDILDESSLKKMILLFEKKALRNQEMRIKFPDNPEKFMESEIELAEIIQELHVIATVPDLYPVMVGLHAVPSLLELLAHDNTDISVAVVDFIQELTDVDILTENTEGADSLIDALLNQQACSLLVQNLERLNEAVKEESDGVHNTLAIFENLTEFRPEVSADAARQGLMPWLLRRLRVKMPYDANKLYASEILSILLQDTHENRLLLGDLEGIDTLLQQLAFYKRHDPSSAEEQEMMENLFNCLCSCLMYAPNRDRFLRGEGLQLMNLMLREKKLSRNGSLKVLDHAMSGPDGKENCNKFVDILGLRTIFPLYMKTPKRNRKRILTAEEHEEHVASIICSMLRNCRGPQRSRLLGKFTENDHEKVDRLLELHFKYLEKVDDVDRQIESDRRRPDNESDEESDYLRRLDNGLFTLQLVDYILMEVATTAPPTVKQRMTKILALRGGSLKTIRHIMREYAGNLGDAGDSEWRELEQQHILQLVDKF